jgi:hypothetical protein
VEVSRIFSSDSVSAYHSPTLSCAYAKFDDNHVHLGPVILTVVHSSTKSMKEEREAAYNEKQSAVQHNYIILTINFTSHPTHTYIMRF